MEHHQQNPEEEKRKQLISATGSVLFVAVLLVWFALHSCWSPPDPPHPSYGIELNFGMDASGFGDQQTQTPANNSENATPEEPSPGENAEASEAESASSSSEQAVESQAESETYIPSESESSEPATQPSENNPSTSENAREAPSYDQQSGARNASGSSESAPANNNGDQPGEVGDQGDPEGSVDSKALYGQQGSGGDGASLDMTGWRWDRIPKPNDKTDEEGRIVFKIKVDDMGEIVSIRTIESTVSPSTVKIYENEVRRLTFSKTRDNVRPAPFSEGKITFLIRSN